MARRSIKKANDNAMIGALKFVSIAQAEIGTPYQTHCRIANGYITGFDGVLAAGTPIDGEFSLCPHTRRFLAALEQATGTVSLTALDSNQLAVSGDKFKAFVPCIPGGDLMNVAPDENKYALTDAFREALSIASTFTTAGATQVAYASVCTRDGSIIGTNGQVVMEVWHGNRTPPDMLIPEQFAAALDKIPKKIVGFGFGLNDTGWIGSLTVWFEDQSFVRSQLYVQERYPSVDKALSWCDGTNPTEVNPELFDGIKAVSSFAETGRVYFTDGLIRSSPNDREGATYQLPGLPGNMAFNAKYMLQLEDFADKFDFTTNDRVGVFFGSTEQLKIRGVIAKGE